MKKKNKQEVAYITPPLTRNEKSWECVVGENVKVKVDPKSKASFFNFVFELPDHSNAVCTLIKESNGEWKPAKEISSIVIYFK